LFELIVLSGHGLLSPFVTKTQRTPGTHPGVRIIPQA
jgi:hypothetical protein